MQLTLLILVKKKPLNLQKFSKILPMILTLSFMRTFIRQRQDENIVYLVICVNSTDLYSNFR